MGNEMRELLLFFAMMVAVLLVLALMVGWGKFVKYVNNKPEIMSHRHDRAHVHDASSLETDSRQTADRPTMLVPTREQTLDIFRAMRAAGMKRETISGPWRAAGLKFDNNLWTEAAPPPPEEPPQVTPIAGRPTRAQFHDDPDLVFQPPPR